MRRPLSIISAVLMTLAISLATCGARAADDDPLAPNKPLLKPEFIIGVWFQPASSFGVWKARGINTMVGYESESNHTTLEDWSTSATDKDLFMIRQPANNVAADLRESFLLAWLHGDEPDVRKVDPDQMTAIYRQWKAVAPTIPVMVNLSGGNVMFKKTPKDTYIKYIAAADWVGNDFYPVTGWNHPDWLSKVGETVEQLRSWSGNRPQFAFIECSNQQLAWLPKDVRGPTPDEMRAEVWDAVIHGVKGIVYFPEQFNPFSFDAMTSRMSLEVARNNRKLTAIADILAQPMNPPGINLTVDAPLEVGWRRSPDGKLYLIVLNMSGTLQQSQPVRIAGYAGKKAKVLNGEDRTLNIYETGFVDRFDPFEPHVYELGGD